MKFCVHAAALLMFAAVGRLSAQWPTYKEPAVPRGPDGKVKMDAPMPRGPDGHPDLSGIWDFRNSRGIEGENITVDGNPDTGTGLGPPPRQAFTPRFSQFFNIGATLKGGLPFRPLAAELRARRAAENNKDNPDAHCLPLGLMQLHTHPQPRKIIQTPAVTVILYEAQAGIRQIFTDGRPLPKPEVEPWWYGYSVGHWEGDTLVVETTGFRDDVWLDVEGSPLTNAGKMIERFHRPNFGNLEIDITVDDPTAYTKPWTVKIRQRLLPDTELIEFICNENDRSGPHLVGK
ncbi:MAG: hypothetical protein JO336_08955 [Acidobacteriia bacterium]|nr:hypothetical protein [Terriglobia bacterium]MBV9742425.1 hypothetical protein [Terriglobia bacterium]